MHRLTLALLIWLVAFVNAVAWIALAYHWWGWWGFAAVLLGGLRLENSALVVLKG